MIVWTCVSDDEYFEMLDGKTINFDENELRTGYVSIGLVGKCGLPASRFLSKWEYIERVFRVSGDEVWFIEIDLEINMLDNCTEKYLLDKVQKAYSSDYIPAVKIKRLNTDELIQAYTCFRLGMNEKNGTDEIVLKPVYVRSY